jgi:hypothetical protein
MGTLVILKFWRVRISPEQELEGPDVSMNREEGYNLEA